MELRDISPDRTWPTCPMYETMVEALAACGLQHEAEVALITHPKKWTRTDWPHPDPAVCKTFHEDWQRRLHERLGIDAKAQPKNTGARGTPRRRHTVRDKVLAALDTTEALLPEVVALHADHPVRQTHWSLLALYRDGLVEREVVECATTTTRPGWKYKKLYAYRRAA